MHASKHITTLMVLATTHDGAACSTYRVRLLAGSFVAALDEENLRSMLLNDGPHESVFRAPSLHFLIRADDCAAKCYGCRYPEMVVNVSVVWKMRPVEMNSPTVGF